jgi:uncharacterized protein (DUF924 family)
MSVLISTSVVETRESFVELETYAGRRPASQDKGTAERLPSAPPLAASVVSFWRDAGPDLWFAKDAGFDRRFHDRFLIVYEAATRGKLSDWQTTPNGALALVLLLDQFPRNAFRGTARMYASDEMARIAAAAAVERGHDLQVPAELRLFFYLPCGHSEALADQERSVALVRSLGEPHLAHALHHQDIIRQFGRFPHRNPILGRIMTEAEQRYLDGGGYTG